MALLQLLLFLTLRAHDASRQCVVVTTPDWSSTRGTLQRYVHRAGHWQPVGPSWPVALGRNGMAASADLVTSGSVPHKREGDGCSPAGLFRLVCLFGWGTEVADLPAGRLPLLRVLPSSRCVDDAASKHYNRIVDGNRVRDFSSAEKMQIPEYRLGVVVDYNLTHPHAGDGSCIFMHIWDGPDSTTSGCTAMSLDNMRTLARWLRPEDHPLLIEMPLPLYEAHRAEHHWP